jgi:hypothetical protein
LLSASEARSSADNPQCMTVLAPPISTRAYRYSLRHTSSNSTDS